MRPTQQDPGVTSAVGPTSAEDDAWRALAPPVKVVLRPAASPTSLGLFGLAAATLTLAGLQLGWVPASEGHYVALVLIRCGQGPSSASVHLSARTATQRRVVFDG